MTVPQASTTFAGLTVRPMRAADVEPAGRIVRLAFGTFLGVPEPQSLWPDRDPVGTRWRANPDAAFVAELDGVVVGSNLATNWGSFAFFGPLTVQPPLWNRGIAQHLLVATLDRFAQWGVRDAGLFTFAHSPRHVQLYEKFGFAPRFLTALLSKPVESHDAAGAASTSRYSELTDSRRVEVLDACRRLTDALHAGLDVGSEIAAVDRQRLGDTVLLWSGDALEAFAVCHCGPNTEAGSATCYVKFAAARTGPHTETLFCRLLDAAETLASDRTLTRMETGVNVGRSRAYRAALRYGYRAQTLGVAMQRPDAAGYNRPEVYILDDWR